MDAAIRRVVATDPKYGHAYVAGVLAGIISIVETTAEVRDLATQVLTSFADDGNPFGGKS